jgi:predicted dehydrogenase
MAQPLRVGLVGPGRVGKVHIQAIRDLGTDTAVIGGVVGSNPTRGAQAASHLGVDHYGSLYEMLVDVEVVHVATPNSLHREHVLAALAAGRHVVCEKPLGLNSEETAEMLAAAESAGVVHATNFQRRSWSMVKLLRSILTSGELGDVWHIRGHYLQDWLVDPRDDDWRTAHEEGGEIRAVLDIGSHVMDLAEWVTDLHIAEVRALLSDCVPRRRHSNDLATLALTLDGGAHVTLTISQASHGSDELALSVDAAKGGIDWSQSRPDILTIRRRGAQDERLEGPSETRDNSFTELYRVVYQAVRQGRSASGEYPTFADGHRMALIMEAVARSATAGSAVTVGSEPPPVSDASNRRR